MTGSLPQLATFCEELNGGVTIGETLLFQLINAAKPMIRRRERHRQVPPGPLQQRLEFKEAAFTFVHDVANDIYRNGTVSAGTLYLDHIKDSTDLTNASNSEWGFPDDSHALFGFLAVAMHKGGIDYDDVNARQLVQNNADAARLFQRLVGWDAELQLSAQEDYDRSGDHGSGWRPNAINIH